MKKWLALLLSACMPLGALAIAEDAETIIVLSNDAITVNGEAICEDVSSPVHLVWTTETHEDVPEELQDVENRVVTITAAGTYRVSGAAQDVQIAVAADEEDEVRLILDGADITCRTAPGIIVASAKDPRMGAMDEVFAYQAALASIKNTGFTIVVAESRN